MEKRNHPVRKTINLAALIRECQGRPDSALALRTASKTDFMRMSSANFSRSPLRSSRDHLPNKQQPKRENAVTSAVTRKLLSRSANGRPPLKKSITSNLALSQKPEPQQAAKKTRPKAPTTIFYGLGNGKKDFLRKYIIKKRKDSIQKPPGERMAQLTLNKPLAFERMGTSNSFDARRASEPISPPIRAAPARISKLNYDPLEHELFSINRQSTELGLTVGPHYVKEHWFDAKVDGLSEPVLLNNQEPVIIDKPETGNGSFVMVEVPSTETPPDEQLKPQLSASFQELSSLQTTVQKQRRGAVKVSKAPPEKKPPTRKLSGQLEWILGSRSARVAPERAFPCNCKRKDEIACERARKWMKIVFERNGRQYEPNHYREQYELLANFQQKSDSTEQIQKDLMRTFPRSDYFGSPESPGTQRLRRVLQAFSLYDRGLGYVQGMNFIVGSLLFHCRQQVAFWLFISLLQDYEVRDIYEHGLPGLYKHCQVIDLLIMEQLPKIYHHFVSILHPKQCEHGIVVELFATDWIFSLCSSVLPQEKMGVFFCEFFAQGWPFFYKFVLACLKNFADLLLAEDDIASILAPLKHWDDTGLPSTKAGDLFSFFRHKDPWDRLLSTAKSWKLNEDHIISLLGSYDAKIKSFNFAR